MKARKPMSRSKRQCKREPDYQIKQEQDYQRIIDAFKTNEEPLHLIELRIHRTATQASGRYKHITLYK